MNKRRSLQDGGEPIEYEHDWSDKIEPYTSAIALGGDVIGLGTALTGVGAPAGAAIAGIANIPNLVVDGYQSYRDWKRVKDDNASIAPAIWNTGELLLDLFGAKYALKGAKAINDRKILNEINYRYQKELAKRNKRNYVFLKGKLTDKELTEYISQKAMNAAINSKHVMDLKKKSNKDTARTAKIINNSMQTPIDAYNSRDLVVPIDNTRNIKQIYLK